MASVEPAGTRLEVTAAAGGLRVSIPARRNWFVAAFLFAWLCAWAIAEMSVLKMLLHSKTLSSVLSGLLWFGAWSLIGIWAMYTFLWIVNGREDIFLDRFHLRLYVQKRLLGIGLKPREFDFREIRDLRVFSGTYKPSGFAAQRASSAGYRTIAFEYGERTCHFGAGLDDAEARIILGVVKEHLERFIRDADQAVGDQSPDVGI